MSLFELFNSFRLNFDMKCLDCANQETMKFCLGDLYNLEGDFINKRNIDYNYMCSICNLNTFIDFVRLFSADKIRKIYDGIILLQENNG